MSKMASFFAGLGSGYLKADRQRSEDERRDKKDAQDKQLFDARMDEINQGKADKQGLRDAGAERTTMTGTAVTDGGGNKNLYADPMQASAAAEDAKIEAEMRGQQPSMVKMQDATGITGKMAKGHQITTDPVDLKTINGAEARAGRFQAELERQGKPLEALNMSNAVIDNKAKTLGLKTEELKFADSEFNRGVFAKLEANPDWTQGAAQLLTDTQVGRLAGLTVKPVVSADGKTVSFAGTGADGATQVLATLPNTPDGRLQFTQQLMKATPETKISWLVESSKSAKQDSRDAQGQSNWQATFDFNKKKDENDQQHRQRVLGLQGAQERRSAEVHKLAMEDAKIPAAIKLQATSLAKQMENIGSALNKAMAEGQFDPNNAGTAKLIESQAALGIKYSMLLKPYTPGAESNADPLGLMGDDKPEAKPADEVKPAGPPARPPARPSTSMSNVVAASAPAAPTRSTDGGKSWQLSVPETVRDPSVSYYKLMPNPMFATLGNKSFASRQEAEQAYRAATQ